MLNQFKNRSVTTSFSSAAKPISSVTPGHGETNKSTGNYSLGGLSHQLLTALFIVTSFLLSACQQKPTLTNLPDNMTTELRANYLKRAEYWQLTGRIAIITEQESDSANISWQRSAGKSVLRIYGTLGTTYALLTVEAGKAVVELPDDKVYHGNDPEQLLWQTTGWIIPVNKMQQWILGVNDETDSVTTNEAGLPASINFKPWTVKYQKYSKFAGLTMPKKLRANHPDITLKFSIHNWSFSPDD
ncbi:MAG: lipoprotein insertase outer membrane protein LolB [Kangiellaceae bacterium]|jgi:outer membrane lipoprotein LolB|nr:lipoprotein insertase outer membrane protein LolB [Kangiellaceae bacterium]